MKLNRDWKTFNRRWTCSRFEMFLVWSVAAHFALAWLVSIPMLTAYQEKDRLDKVREEEKRVEEKKIEQLKEEIQKQAQTEIQAMLKEEIAEEQLKPVFEEMTKDFLSMELTDLYWDDLLLELDSEFEDLLEFFDSPEFNQVDAEQMIMGLKEKTVEKLQDLVARKQFQGLKDEAKAKVEQAAQQLAQHFKNELDKSVAQPVAADFDKKIAEEKQKALAALRKAEQELQQLAEPVKKVAEDLNEAEKKFGELDKQQKDADGKKDKQLAAEVAKQTKEVRAGLIATGAEIRKLPAKLKAAGKALEGVYPQAAEELKKIEGNAEAASKNQAETLKTSAEGKLTDSAAKSKDGKEDANKVLEGIRKVQAAIKLQLAAMQADELKGETAQLAKTANEQGKEKDVAVSGKDEKGKQAVAVKIAAAEKTAGDVAAKALQLAKDVAATEKNLPGAKSDQGKDDQSRNDSSKDDKSKDAGLKSVAEKASDKLKEGKDLLGKQAPKEAETKFAAAGKEIDDLQKAIKTAQEKLGLPGDDPARALAAKLQKLSEKELAGKVDAKFGQAVKSTTIPAILQKLEKELDKKLGTGEKGTEIKKEIASNAEKTLQKLLVEDVKAGQVFAKSAAEKLPETPAGMKDSKNPQVKDAADKAQKAAEVAIDRNVAALVTAGMRQPALAELGNFTRGADTRQTDLMRRLELLKQRLDAKQKEFLGQVDGVGVAAARQRLQNRKASAGRGIGLRQDPKALEKLVNIIKDRGHITGELFNLKTADGELAKLEEESTFQPNLIAVPTLPDKEAPKDAGERKVKAPDFKTIRFSGIPFVADDAIKIDGDLGDWKDLPKLELDGVNRGPGPPVKASPAHQTGYAAFNSSGLVLAVDVIDTSGSIETKYWKRIEKDGRTTWDGAFWQNDCIEIYLDTLNTKDSRRGEPNTHQFFVFPFSCEDDENGGYESYMAKGQSWAKVPHSKEVIRKAGKKTEKGWTLEVLIPRSIIRRGDLNPGRIIGFNIQVDTGTALYYFWTCNVQLRTSEHPQTWGDLQFLGSDARVEVLHATRDEPTKTVVPGQPLRVRVTDPDMNLNPDKKDKVSVTLRTISGDSETILLEETDVKSGVFVGGIPTRLDIGVRVAGVAELLEGEIIDVEYIDQARAYGERNQPIRTAFAASSIGTKFGD